MALDSQPPLQGIEQTQSLDQIVEHHLGTPLPELLLDPQPQVSLGLMEVAPGVALAIGTGQFRQYPGVSWERIARLGFHEAASSASASGLPVKAITVSVCFPCETPGKDVEEFWRRIHREAGKFGVAVVANHTSFSPFASSSHIGACAAVASGPSRQAVSPSNAGSGDVILMTQSAGLEAAALLGMVRAREVEESFGEGFAEDAAEMSVRLSTLRDAATASTVGVGPDAVTSMYNVGLGGILRALETIARASGMGLEVNREHLGLSDEVDAICTHFGLDPLKTASQGVLLITCRPSVVDDLLGAFRDKEVLCTPLGRVTDEFTGVRVLDHGEEVNVELLEGARLEDILDESILQSEQP